MATSIDFLEKMLANANVQAALKVIRYTECKDTPDCYQYVFGSSPNNKLRFTDFSKHPDNLQKHNGISSTAAGAYQILKRTYDELCATYKFTDFTPHTQDLMCCALFDRRGVLAAISKGKFLSEEVMGALSEEWASLPYSSYGQPTHSIADVRTKYLENGGSFA